MKRGEEYIGIWDGSSCVSESTRVCLDEIGELTSSNASAFTAVEVDELLWDERDRWCLLGGGDSSSSPDRFF